MRRFFAYVAERQGVPHPHVESTAVQDYLTHLAVRQRVSASTQNQALCAILFLCREVLGVQVEDLSPTARAKRGSHLPVVLSMPETAAVVGARRGTTWLMAALIYGGGLRVSEWCQLRVKDIDVEQGPIDRRYDLATLTVHTAGNHNSTVTLPGLLHADALAMREAIRSAIRQDQI